MEKDKLIQEFQCEHFPKKFRIMIDGGLGEIINLSLCLNCNKTNHLKYVIREDMLC